MKKSELTAFIKEEIKSTLTTEGVWSKGDDTAIRDFILDVKQLKDDYYNIVGSDDVFDGLDAAIRAANDLIAMNEDTQQDIKDTEELTKAVADLAKAKEEAGLSEENIGLADIEEMGYEAGERAFENIKSRFKNKPDHQAYRKGFFQGYIDNAGNYGLNEAEDKEPSKADLKATKGLAKAKEELALLTREMKSLAKKYSKAEGQEKEKLVADLKKKTKLKKELEAIIDK
jgi:hypothetical protein